MGTSLPPDAERRLLGIAFLDLARFARWADLHGDEEIAGRLQHFYGQVARGLAPFDGRVVKVIGDAVLVVFDADRLAEAVDGLQRLSRDVERDAGAAGFDTTLSVKVHVGEVIGGSFGPPGLERFDVLGRAVNETAMLGGEGLVLSDAAQARLA